MEKPLNSISPPPVVNEIFAICCQESICVSITAEFSFAHLPRGTAFASQLPLTAGFLISLKDFALKDKLYSML